LVHLERLELPNLLGRNQALYPVELQVPKT